MPRINQNDLNWTIDGDFLVSETGDIKDTDETGINLSDALIPTRQTIIHRVICEKGGWALYPNICAGLESFIGRTVDDTLLRLIESQVKSALISDGVFSAGETTVKAIDLQNDSIALMVWIKGSDSNQRPILTGIYDVQSGQISQVRS